MSRYTLSHSSSDYIAKKEAGSDGEKPAVRLKRTQYLLPVRLIVFASYEEKDTELRVKSSVIRTRVTRGLQFLDHAHR